MTLTDETSSRPTLPPEFTPGTFGAFRTDTAAWLPAAAAVAKRHQLEGALTPIPEGSNLVAAVGEGAILKVFDPKYRSECEGERLALSAVAGRLGTATPEVWHAGEIDGWPYLVLSRVPGVQLRAAWAGMGAVERVMVATQLGHVARAMHQTPLEGLESLRLDWPAFVRSQLASLIEREQKMGLADTWLTQLPAYMAGAEEDLIIPFTPVLVHADLTDDNTLVIQRDGHWHLSGVIDFADAFIGPATYELVAAGLAALRGDPAAVRAFLLAYGLTPEALTPGLRRQLMLYDLLHRYAHLSGDMKRAGVGPEVTTMAALEWALWPVGE